MPDSRIVGRQASCEAIIVCALSDILGRLSAVELKKLGHQNSLGNLSEILNSWPSSYQEGFVFVSSKEDYEDNERHVDTGD